MSTARPNEYLDYLIDPCFQIQRVNRFFVLSFEDEPQRTNYNRCYLPIVEIKNYNVIIDEQTL